MAEGWYGFYLDVPQTRGYVETLRQLAQEYERPAGLGRLELTITPAGSLDKAVVDQYADLGVDRLVLLPQPDAAPSQRHAPVAMDRILRNIDTVAEQIISPRQEVSWGVDNEPEYQVGIRRPSCDSAAVQPEGGTNALDPAAWRRPVPYQG